MRVSPLLVAALLACGGPPVDPEPPTQQEVVAVAGDDVEVPVGTEVTLDGRASTNGDAVWDLGDGTQIEGLLAAHTYTEPGNYVVVLSVTGPGGLTRTDSLRVTAYLPAADPAPASFTGLGLDPERPGEVWVPVPETGQVAVVDTTDGSSEVLDVCDTPRGAAAATGSVAITCEGDGTLVVIDAASRSISRTYTLGRGTQPVGVTGRGGDWWAVTRGRGELFTVSSGALDATFFGTDLRAVAVDSAGSAWAPRWRSSRLRGDVHLPDGAKVTLAPDPGPDTDTAHRGVPNLLEAIVISPDGGTVFVGGEIANISRGLFRDGKPLTFESTVRAVVRRIDASVEPPAEQLERRKNFDNHGRVSAMTLSPRGNWLWVAHPGTGTVHRLDAYTLDIKGAITDAGIGVTGLAISPDGATLYAHAWLDRELRAFDVSDPSRPPTLLWAASTVDQEPLSPAVLQGKRLFHTSADPRLSRHGYIACASCHPYGTHDGMTWDFTDRGEGLRNTITLEGHGGTDMGRLHWSGNMDEVQDFEADIRHAQGGSGLLPDSVWDDLAIQRPLGDSKAGLSADLDALAAYVGSLTRFPESPYNTSGNGATLFAQSGCTSCHNPDTLYTDSSLDTPTRHDIGTWTDASGTRLNTPFRDFDTPTLIGVWATPPYLHDGSAATLEAAIGAHTPNAVLPSDLVTIAAWLQTLGPGD